MLCIGWFILWPVDLISIIVIMMWLGNTHRGHTATKQNISKMKIDIDEENHTIFFRIIFSGPHQQFSSASLYFPIVCGIFKDPQVLLRQSRLLTSHIPSYPIWSMAGKKTPWENGIMLEVRGTRQRPHIFWHSHEVIPAGAAPDVWYLFHT